MNKRKLSPPKSKKSILKHLKPKKKNKVKRKLNFDDHSNKECIRGKSENIFKIFHFV